MVWSPFPTQRTANSPGGADSAATKMTGVELSQSVRKRLAAFSAFWSVPQYLVVQGASCLKLMLS